MIEQVHVDKTELKQRIGNQVRLWRNDRGMKQEQLAEAVNVSNTTMSRIENGNQLGSIHQLTKIAVALKVEPGELINVLDETFEPEETETDVQIMELYKRFSGMEKEYLLCYMKSIMEIRKKIYSGKKSIVEKFEDNNG